ncbi:MAG: hypothetical protein PW786_00075 [Arachidicoccus sp.]|nr:hypothetical protein [Arachidicoccus sp.]
MKILINSFVFMGTAILSFCYNTYAQRAQTTLPDWALGSFSRPEPTGAILLPDSNAVFTDSVTNKEVHW